MVNAVNWWELFGESPAAANLTTDPGGFLVADQSGRAWPALRTVWFSSLSAPTNGVYRVAADFRPAAIQPECRGGVMGWLDTGRSNGIVLQVVPAGSTPSFRVATVDFLGEEANVNESATNLYSPLDGLPAAAELGSTWAEPGENYVATNFATLELTFSAPTSADTNVLPSVTSRLTARVFQVDATGVTNEVSAPIELLTDLPLPEGGAHALGYFTVWASESEFGSLIGHLDNLVADNVGTRPNTPPTVRITSPASGAVFVESDVVTLEADATDTDGSVMAVEYFAGTTFLGTATNALFSLAWSNVTAGDYALTGLATDDRGATSVSEPVNITVNPSSSTAPTLVYTYATNGILLAWGATGYQLQTKADLNFGVWADWPEDTRGATQITVPYGAGVQFFRLVGTGTPAGPALSISRAGGQVTLSWPATAAGYRLQSKAELNATTWTDLSTTGNTYSEPASSGDKFFRLVNP
jgi:hypothetical protein